MSLVRRDVNGLSTRRRGVGMPQFTKTFPLYDRLWHFHCGRLDLYPY